MDSVPQFIPKAAVLRTLREIRVCYSGVVCTVDHFFYYRVLQEYSPQENEFLKQKFVSHISLSK